MPRALYRVSRRGNVAVRALAALAAILLAGAAVRPAGAQTSVPIPPMPVLLGSCIRDEARGVAVSFVNVDSVPVGKVTVDFAGPNGSAERTTAAGDFEPGVRTVVYLDPKLDALLPGPRLSKSAIACRITAVTYSDGTGWTRERALNLPTPLPSGALPPVTFTTCAYDPAKGQLNLAYRNAAQKPLTFARMRLQWADRQEYVELSGTVAPGAAAQRSVSIPLGNAQSPVPPVDLRCSLANAQFAGLPAWSDADISNSATVAFPALGNGIAITACMVDEAKIFRAQVRNVTVEPIGSVEVVVSWPDTATTKGGSTSFALESIGPRGTRRYENEEIGKAISDAQSAPACSVHGVIYADGERWPQ